MNADKRWTVADVMTESVTTVETDTPFKAVVEQICVGGVSALPVGADGRGVRCVPGRHGLLKEGAGPARPGGPAPSCDKPSGRGQLEVIGWNTPPPAPALPEDVVAGTSARYLEAMHRLVATPAPARP